MDRLHYNMWQESKAEYVNAVTDDCNYRIEQLSQNHRQREENLRGMIKSTSDEKIIRMRNSQINKLTLQYEEQKKALKEAIDKADIHTNLLVKGVLRVE